MDQPKDATPPAAAVHASSPALTNAEREPFTEQTQPPPEKPPTEAKKKPGFFSRLTARRTEKPQLTPQRVYFYVDDKAHIDLARVQPENLERLKTALSTKEARQALGLDESGATTARPSVAGMLVTNVNLIAVQMAANTWKLTEDQARLLLLHKAKGTDVHGKTVYQNVELLTEELLTKYFPGGFGDYDKEISLLLILGGFTTNAIQKIKEMRAAPATGPREVVNNINRGAASTNER